MIGRPAGVSGIDAGEAQILKIEPIDEGIDEANRIALVDPVIEALRQQRRLRPIRPFNEARHHFPRRIQQENHSSEGVFTQPGSCSERLILSITRQEFTRKLPSAPSTRSVPVPRIATLSVANVVDCNRRISNGGESVPK